MRVRRCSAREGAQDPRAADRSACDVLTQSAFAARSDPPRERGIGESGVPRPTVRAPAGPLAWFVWGSAPARHGDHGGAQSTISQIPFGGRIRTILFSAALLFAWGIRGAGSVTARRPLGTAALTGQAAWVLLGSVLEEFIAESFSNDPARRALLVFGYVTRSCVRAGGIRFMAVSVGFGRRCRSGLRHLPSAPVEPERSRVRRWHRVTRCSRDSSRGSGTAPNGVTVDRGGSPISHWRAP